MTLVLRCRDIGFDCDGIIKAEDEEELMTQVTAHAGEVHDITEVTPELVEKVRSAVTKE